MNGANLVHIRPFLYKWISVSGKVGTLIFQELLDKSEFSTCMKLVGTICPWCGENTSITSSNILAFTTYITKIQI